MEQKTGLRLMVLVVQTVRKWLGGGGGGRGGEREFMRRIDSEHGMLPLDTPAQIHHPSVHGLNENTALAFNRKLKPS